MSGITICKMSSGNFGKNSGIRNIFDAMAYEDKATGNLTTIKEWLGKHKNVLSSCVLGTPIAGDSASRTIRLEGLTQPIGTDVKAQLLNNEARVVDAYQSILKNTAKFEAVKLGVRLDRRSKFQDLLKNKSKDLVQLEAYAGNVPAWIVQKHDQPTWLQISYSITEEIRKQIEAGNWLAMLRLEEKSYCLRNIIALLTAMVQVDGHVLVLISPNDDSNIRQLLPIIYLIDAVNRSGIRDQEINVLLVTTELLNGGLLKKLTVPAELTNVSLKTKPSRGYIELFDAANIGLESIVTMAAFDLSTSNGQSVHYVVDSSADVVSAISSLSRNVWSCGIEINHRCRSLAFVHEPVYAQVVKELQENVEKMKVSSWDSNALTNCDFVSRKVDESSAAISSIRKLGAKLIAAKPNYSVPTVVYDIGTSSDLVATKKAGLGHILVLIPYRSLNELFSLGNNFGVPDKICLYSNCLITSMSIIKKLKATEILVNSASSHRSSLFSSPWQVSKFGSTHVKEERSNGISKVKPEASQWRELSYSSKIEMLNQLVKATEMDPVLPMLLAYYIQNVNESSLSLPNTNDYSCSGVVVADTAGISTSTLLIALIACVLRDRPVVIVSLGVEFPSIITKAVKEHLPAGLVSFLVVESVRDIELMASSWDLIWVFQGSDKTLQLDFVKPQLLNRFLLVNSPADNNPEFNSRVAIASAHKKCWF